MKAADLQLTLVSHTLCPYVQRAAISLAEKGVPFERVYIDLSNKPDWFVEKSPLGKVPILLVSEGDNTAVIFESSVILEYLEETQPHPLHPHDPLRRAQHRSWIEYGSEILNNIARLYNAPDKEAFSKARDDLSGRMARLNKERARQQGPFFAGESFCLVDAVYAPVFRYFDVFEEQADLFMLNGLLSIDAWRMALSKRTSVKNAVTPEYSVQLTQFLRKRRSHISAMIKPTD
ncbi:glutathione S-transferase family protein [Kordiimonas sp.]|uniref:glutathione S-transferase family protein n=1 Tax=Kordiimonas sp. TaxID=1970157 RepID=UPI003B5220F8